MSWNTRNEIDYINGLVYGEHFSEESTHRCKITPRDLLKNYLESALRRSKQGTWGEVDSATVIRHARELLRDLPESPVVEGSPLPM
jgi:hypothetical protein